MARYIVNQKGAVHSVPDDWAVPHGCREATPEEIRQWLLDQGIEAEVTNDGTSEHGSVNKSSERPHRRSRR